MHGLGGGISQLHAGGIGIASAALMRRLALAALFLLCGCPKKDAPDAGVEGPSPTQEWLEGRLPKSALEGKPVKGGSLPLRVPVEPNGLNRLHDAMAEGTMTR